MKAQLTRYEIKDMMEDIGSNLVFIYLYFKTTSHPETPIPLMVSYDKLHEFIKEVDEPAYNYLTKIRSDIGGYGPKNIQIFKVIRAENFDLEPFLKLYLEKFDEVDIEQHYEWCERMTNQTPETKKSIEEFLEIFEDYSSDDAIDENIKWEEFIDTIDQTLHEVTLKFYPDLFEMGEEYIEEYQRILSYATMRFSEEIDKLRHKKFDN
jgi:hypothetical protein